jgi:hypothetical protein
MSLYDKVSELDVEELGLQQSCEVLVEINAIKNDIAMIIDDLQKKISPLFGKQDIVDAGDYVVERRMGKPRSAWRHKELGDEVANRVWRSAIDLDTGELTMTPTELMAKMLDFLQPSYWRVTALDSIGISADSYCETREAQEKISIRKQK